MRNLPAWLCRSILTICTASIACLFTPYLPTANAQSVTPTPADLEFFEKQVRPLLTAHCLECHGGGETNGGLSLDSRAAWMKGGDSGPAIVPNQPDQSRLIEAVGYKNRDLQMPPKKALSESEVATLVEWVKRGAPDPRESNSVHAAPVKGMSLEDGRKFWSFQPISDPAIPVVKNVDRVRTGIDAFILAKLEEHSLAPAARADKRTLIRRATFDLIGLPPTESQVAAFLADSSDDAFEKVVDRLLESPQYGVRWAGIG